MAVEKAGRPKIVSIESLRAKAKAKAKAETEAKTTTPRAGAPGPLASPESDSAETLSEKVLEARRRLSEGFYDRPEVRLDTLRALLGEPREGDRGRSEGSPP